MLGTKTRRTWSGGFGERLQTLTNFFGWNQAVQCRRRHKLRLNREPLWVLGTKCCESRLVVFGQAAARKCLTCLAVFAILNQFNTALSATAPSSAGSSTPVSLPLGRSNQTFFVTVQPALQHAHGEILLAFGVSAPSSWCLREHSFGQTQELGPSLLFLLITAVRRGSKNRR